MATIALVGASYFNQEQFEQMDAAGAFDKVIAVDAGYAHLESIGRVPDIALGDFDSLGYVPTGVRTSKFPAHKDKSDMELALDRARTMHASSVYVFGALGRRLDHTLANLQIFSAASEQGLKICAIDVDFAIFFVTGPDAMEAEARANGAVSVFSMSDNAQGVFERGLEWELDDYNLSNRSSVGLSNELKGEPVMIGVESGTIAIFFPL